MKHNLVNHKINKPFLNAYLNKKTKIIYIIY